MAGGWPVARVLGCCVQGLSSAPRRQPEAASPRAPQGAGFRSRSTGSRSNLAPLRAHRPHGNRPADLHPGAAAAGIGLEGEEHPLAQLGVHADRPGLQPGALGSETRRGVPVTDSKQRSLAHAVDQAGASRRRPAEVGTWPRRARLRAGPAGALSGQRRRTPVPRSPAPAPADRASRPRRSSAAGSLCLRSWASARRKRDLRGWPRLDRGNAPVRGPRPACPRMPERSGSGPQVGAIDRARDRRADPTLGCTGTGGLQHHRPGPLAHRSRVPCRAQLRLVLLHNQQALGAGSLHQFGVGEALGHWGRDPVGDTAAQVHSDWGRWARPRRLGSDRARTSAARPGFRGRSAPGGHPRSSVRGRGQSARSLERRSRPGRQALPRPGKQRRPEGFRRTHRSKRNPGPESRPTPADAPTSARKIRARRRCRSRCSSPTVSCGSAGSYCLRRSAPLWCLPTDAWPAWSCSIAD